MVNVLVVGGGAAAIAASHQLVAAGVEVEILEAGPSLGGNCMAVRVGDVVVDAGVSDFNRRTFVRVDAMMRELDVPVRPIDESASVMYPDGTLAWTSRDPTLREEIERFRREAPAALAGDGAPRLGEYARGGGYSAAFVDRYLEPRAAGAFPMPDADPASYDLRSLVGFWQMHGLVGAAPRERVCVVGGMARYCGVFEARLRARGGRVTTSARVREIRRVRRGVEAECVIAGRREVRRADHVIVAVAPPVAMRLLADVDGEERRALLSIGCQTGELYVHTDPRLMPADRAAWGAFNYVASRPGAGLVRPTITFYPHRLAGIAGAEHVFVTLNPCVRPRPELVLQHRTVIHPRATGATPRVPQGRRNTWFAGSYLAAPWLHEQAYASGHAAAAAILGQRPTIVRSSLTRRLAPGTGTPEPHLADDHF